MPRSFRSISHNLASSVVAMSVFLIAPHDAAAQAAGASDAGEQHAAALAYRWPLRGRLAYAVTIESTRNHFVDRFDAVSVYSVRHGANGEAVLEHMCHAMVERDVHPRRRAGAGRERYEPPTVDPAGRLILPAQSVAINDRGPQAGEADAAMRGWWLSDIGRLPFVTLPSTPAATWTVERECLAIDEGKLGELGLVASLDETERRAVERTAYSVAGNDGGIVALDVQYAAHTHAQVAAAPRFEAVGTGSVAFDAARGLVRSAEYDLRVVQATAIFRAALERPENFIVQLPVKVTIRLLSDDQLAAHLAALSTSQTAIEAQRQRSIDTGEFTQAVADLSSVETSRRLIAVGRLARLRPMGDRRHVVGRILPLLGEPNETVRKSAVRALGVWGEQTEVPKLIPLLEDRSFGVRWATLDALGAMRDAQAVEAIVWHIELGNDEPRAMRALTASGAVAEPAAIGLLDNYDWSIRREACRLLRDVGGVDSAAALRNLSSTEENSVVVISAGEALTAIERRLASADAP